ncbi:MAG TPA: AAA family ATPase [Gammaproteobacteria bacterium]|jgi:hypothetical protein|nr:AAA family ATPase [Gammaproteobacteria bacterium]
MLIKFSVENWQSFRDEAVISMIASREQQHQDRLAKIDKYKMRLLPLAAIYGGNASGKTKFFNALEFVQRFVVRVTQPESAIPREYFRLDKEYANKPTKFNFEILVDNICYGFSFSVTQREVVEEKLTEISSHSEKILYYRVKGKKIDFSNDSKLKSDNRLRFVADGTRDNQLFLTASIDQKIEYFQTIYDWFKHKLVLITPETAFVGVGYYFEENNPVSSSMNDILAKLDTGITRLGGVDVPIDSIQMLESVKIKLLEEIPEGGSVPLLHHSGGRVVISKSNGLISAKRLVSYHASIDGKETLFEMNNESAGTLRTIDILPVFYDLCDHKDSKIYVVDEIDRCLHTMMTQALIEKYLQSCSSSTRSQLLFTTHDLLLMDQDLLRRDEIWITERDNNGCSSIISLGDYKGVRYDKDIRKSYLKGSFGGIPKILLSAHN